MKKFYAFISVFLIVGAAMFADVSVKKLADGNVEVTFFYGNPRASEVVIAGDFTNWQNGALPMTKGDKGWTFVKTVPAGTVMKYKFISDGNWTEDMHEPDKVDDGFGGHNGLVDVDAMTAPAASDNAGTAKKANLKFSMWSMLGFQTKWTLKDDKVNELEQGLDSAGINLKSYLKVSGSALPGVPMYIEVALAEQDTFENLYKVDELEWADGWKNLAVDTVFDPIYFYDGQKASNTYLGHLKLGLESDYVNYTTGYKYAKLPPHNINDWVTVDKEWEAGYESVGGFNYFELGPKLQQFGDVTLKMAVSPNRAADRKGYQYGFFGWFDIGYASAGTLSFQYNGAYGKTFDTIFGHSYEHDLIGGYKGIFGPVTVKANVLYNLYGDGDLSKIDGVVYQSKYIPATSDVGEVESDKSGLSNMAANGQILFSNDMIAATLGFRFRGEQASMMYVEDGADDHTNINDQLGDENIMRPWFDVNVNVIDGVNIGVNPYVEMTLDKDALAANCTFKDNDNMKIVGKPYFALDFGKIADINAKVNGYAKLDYMTKDADRYVRGTDNKNFIVEEGGVQYDQVLDGDGVKEVKCMYVFDNGDEKYLWNTLIATVTVPQDINIQLGAGFRSADNGVSDPDNPFGFFVGAFKKLSVLQRPTAYVQYMYAMDPYNKFGDGPTAWRLDGDSWTFKDGVTDYDNSMAVRCGLQWDL